jgi:hypothetical protein
VQDLPGLETLIINNYAFLEELEGLISTAKNQRLFDFAFFSSYMPLHYALRLTPLQFIGVPKIWTVMKFTNRLVALNSATNYFATNARAWLCTKLKQVIETRILYYEQAAMKLTEGADSVVLPDTYSDVIQDQWRLLGLPESVDGRLYHEIPRRAAKLSIKEGGPFGWYLGLDDASDYSFFFDPDNSSALVYQRNNISPEDEALLVPGTLYQKGETEGLRAVIYFDGKTFSINEQPLPDEGDGRIFSGQLH